MSKIECNLRLVKNFDSSIFCYLKLNAISGCSIVSSFVIVFFKKNLIFIKGIFLLFFFFQKGIGIFFFLV